MSPNTDTDRSCSFPIGIDKDGNIIMAVSATFNLPHTAQFGGWPGYAYHPQQETDLQKTNRETLEKMEASIKSNLSLMLESIGKWPHHYEDCINEYTQKIVRDLGTVT